MSMTNPAAPVAMRVVDVRRMPAGSDHPARFVVILEDTGGTRRLPIWVGPPEGIAIALQLERIELPRPPAYRFVANVFLAAGARLREARINRLEDQTFYAIAVVERAGGKRVEVDARPSDVISLALHLGTPIVVDPAVLDAVGAQPEASCAEEENRTDAARAAQIAAEVRASWPAPPSA